MKATKKETEDQKKKPQPKGKNQVSDTSSVSLPISTHFIYLTIVSCRMMILTLMTVKMTRKRKLLLSQLKLLSVTKDQGLLPNPALEERRLQSQKSNPKKMKSKRQLSTKRLKFQVMIHPMTLTQAKNKSPKERLQFKRNQLPQSRNPPPVMTIQMKNPAKKT